MNAATLALSAGLALFALGWWQGTGAERDRWQARAAAMAADRDRLAARIAALTEALGREEARQAELARQLEELANADQESGRISLPARSLQRLERR